MSCCLQTIEGLTLKLKEAEGTVGERDTQITELQDNLKETGEALENVRAEYATAKDKYKGVKRELETAKAQVEVLKARGTSPFLLAFV